MIRLKYEQQVVTKSSPGLLFNLLLLWVKIHSLAIQWIDTTCPAKTFILTEKQKKSNESTKFNSHGKGIIMKVTYHKY